MSRSQLLGIEIAGYGIAVPATQFSNDQLIARNGLDSSDEWIKSRTGIEARYIADASLGETNASLSAAAGRAALVMAGIEPGTLDSLTLATTTPDREVPPTAVAAQRLLGAQGCSAHDLNAACSGFVYALNNGYRRLATGDERALVIGTDLLSRITNTGDRATSVLFGDGSAAVALQRAEREEAGLLSWHETANGDLEELLYCERGGAISMDGSSVFKNAVRLLAQCTLKALERADLKLADLAYVVPHQANQRITEAAARQLNKEPGGFDETKMYWNGDRYANTSSASVGIALAELLQTGRINRGDLIALAGFGAGMTAAAAVIRY